MAVRRAELQRAIAQVLDLKALLVNRTMVATTQQDEVGEGRRPSLGPVLDVMRLAERQVTAREAATVVSIAQRPGVRPSESSESWLVTSTMTPSAS